MKSRKYAQRAPPNRVLRRTAPLHTSIKRRREQRVKQSPEARQLDSDAANDKGEHKSMAFERHRDKNGQISRKHGNTLISTLRKHYGRDFAFGCADTDTLGDV